MKTKPSIQNKYLIISILISVILIILSICGLVYDIYLLQQLINKAPGIDFIFNPYELQFFIHAVLCISVAFSIILAFKYTGKFRKDGIILSVLGTLSFACLVVQGIALYEFYEEFYLGGWNGDFELAVVRVTMAINLLFYGFGFWVIMKSFVFIKNSASQKQKETNEFVFEITQYIGIACGIIGIIFAYNAYRYLGYYSKVLTRGHIHWIYMCCLTFIFPYLLMILYWVVNLVFKKTRSLYDEKQQRDLSSAGLLTWLISIPLMSAFIFISYGKADPVKGIMVFPFYIFTTLLIFSSASLFNFKKA